MSSADAELISFLMSSPGSSSPQPKLRKEQPGGDRSTHPKKVASPVIKKNKFRKKSDAYRSASVVVSLTSLDNVVPCTVVPY
jgi:hypothetical protein